MRNMFKSVILIVIGVVLTRGYYFDEDDNKPIYLTAAVGDYIVFNCDIDFPLNFPVPYKIFWKKQDEVIYSWQDGSVTEADEYVGRIQQVGRDQQKQFGRASINLTSIRESDVGWYECSIIFPNRTPPWRKNGTWFHLTVSGGNLLAIPPINRTVMEGAEVEFACMTKDEDIKVRWYKDGIVLSEYHDLTSRSWVTKENTLVIRPTDSGDYGEYECEAYNSQGDRQTAKAFLNVQYKAKVVYAPPEIHLPFGRPAIIDCHFRANPPLTNLRWEKDGFLFDPYNIQGVFYSKSVRVWTKSLEGETDTLTGPFPSIGYPRNVTVTPVDDGLLVTWLHPDYGLERLKWYIVRWNPAHEDYIFGSGDTTNTSFLITKISEGQEYDIQVVALSIDDQQAVSEKVRTTFPGYKSLGAVSTGVILGFAFLGAGFVVFYYVRRKWCQSYHQPNIKN